ncbi:DNA helicase IV [Micromonospora pattaloongensis]|uniref:DNA helicase IV n=1 Tax=Micromonospora pattaloongensis TaxID=405436 RepID=A0A1H3SEN6_9ACTN|nr:AAA family ATPase [Micromonospora pattaloongensis]SDZ36452.1 DNA helicase IV [Micromonospora pattaloongensis]
MTLPAHQTITEDDLDAQLAAERAHLDASRAALRRMREHAEALFSTGHTVAGDAYTAEALGRQMARRIAELADDPDTPLFFGRLDLRPEQDLRDQGAGSTTRRHDTNPLPDHADHAERARFHIGRRHVGDAAGEPMVLDWRAPLSRAFYRASVRDPQGVVSRRRFGFSGGTLTSFEDEHLDRGEELGTGSRILTAEIERPRVGPMRDIVATIQPEQDELVRAELDTSICVQGAPGTGKTAVGLHRAAYLLYQHRERLRRAGVLIVGPNRAFLSYIAAVLPALGEVEVAQTTVEDLIARVPVRATDDPATASVKHDPRMAEVLRRALDARIGRPAESIVLPDGSFRWRVGAEALARVVDEVRREGLPHATGRERVRARVLALLQRQAEARRAESPSDAWLRRVARSKPVTAFLDEVWPAVTPEALVFGVLCDPEPAAGDLFSPQERALLRWPKPPRSPKTARWTAADAVLIDEAAGLIERPPGFGHVIVDEAQDLSPMQCRAIARRSEHGSITLLGDLAQGTAPWAATDWRDSLAHLGKPDAAVVPLTVGFRVPGAVMALANRLLPALAVDVPPGVSLRADGTLELRTVTDTDAATVTEVRAALGHDGSVAVIAADAAIERLRAALRAAGIETATAEQVGAAGRVTVVPATLVKGLEYDHVVVVEPAEIVAAEPRGLHRLYVVLTRAVSRLSVLHATPLPAPLG